MFPCSEVIFLKRFFLVIVCLAVLSLIPLTGFIISRSYRAPKDIDLEAGRALLQTYDDLDVEKVLKRNDNINNSDEFKFFHDVINNIKANDKDIYLFIINNIDKGEKIIEDLSLTRNVMINYKNKNLSIPRKTVRIVRKNH